MNFDKRIFEKNFFIFCLIISIIMTSCVTQRDLEYFNDTNKNTVEFIDNGYIDYRIKSNDALYIKINSLDDAASNVFANQDGIQQGIDAYSAYLNSYTVDKEGYVLLPVIGNINVLGKTTMEVSELIKDSVTNILSLPIVSVKLVNRFVTILGEVRTPGHFVYSQDKLTIYSAIGLAGDITEYGNRKEIILTRSQNGKNIKTKIDLTSTDILSSPYYYIQPNDLLYVSPLKKRIWGIREFPFTLIFSIITTSLVVYTFIEQQ